MSFGGNPCERHNMKYISEYKEGDRVFDIYLCKQRTAALTKNGKAYETLLLQDKTGTIDAKIWEPDSVGISDFEAFDHVEVYGDVNSFQGALQINVRRIRRCEAREYRAEDYMPTSRHDCGEMYNALTGYVKSLKNGHLRALMTAIFIEDEAFAAAFKNSGAAKSIHHSFIGGLLEHTLAVVRFCDFLSGAYPILHRDLLISAALCHDIGKVRELNPFPRSDYSDDGQLIGHIVIGCEMVGEKIGRIADFPAILAAELKHCILAHHGELAYGSPKKPAIVEAVALSFADNCDAKLQTFAELLEKSKETGWQGYNRIFDTNIIATRGE